MSDVRQIIAEQLSTARSPCVTSSFQADGVVLLHMLRSVAPGTPVLFVDTVHTSKRRVRIGTSWWPGGASTWPSFEPRSRSPGLWERDSDACCARHKVTPLFAALEHYALWFTALRRDQSPSRANLRGVEPFRLPTGTILRKVSPLAGWTTDMVWEYAKAHDIPLLPLYELGYSSIGCQPCTSRPIDPSNLRSGRWQGRRLECGIHIQAAR